MKALIHDVVIAIRRIGNGFIQIPLPKLVEGGGESSQTARLLAVNQCTKVLIVTDNVVEKLALHQGIIDGLKSTGIDYQVFSEVTPDPTVALVERGREVYSTHNCNAIIAIGGGSVIDCAKGIGASVVKNKPINILAGLFRIRKKLPFFIAVPTTAGTGSEATVVAVISEPKLKQKFTVIDPKLVPEVAILDPVLMASLPAKVTAETGIDALTHAIESYISVHATSQSKQYSIEAMQLIFSNLSNAYQDGSNIDARSKMAKASFLAGAAFTRASIGYVHAIAHQLGGYYHIPHGLANAVLLPHVLKFSFDKVTDKYAELAKILAMAENADADQYAATKFIENVEQLLQQLNIQTEFEQIKNNDIKVLAKRAIDEAFCEYPVPKQMSVEQCQDILTKVSQR